jgi:tRNA (cmo5U34)-methyltransferase
MAAVDSNVQEGMGERWEFNSEVARVFDDMLARSIPQYQTMRETVHRLGRRYVADGTTVVDLGCSRGEALAPFVDEFAGRCLFIGCEVSEPMRRSATIRFGSRARVEATDLRHGYPDVDDVSLTLAVLTLQFVPINYRQRIVADAHRTTRPGGAMILVEKVLGDGQLDDDFVDLYHDAKRMAGYSQEEVERKRLSLEGVLVPVTARWNQELLERAGFGRVDCFWRWCNFAAWIAVR